MGLINTMIDEPVVQLLIILVVAIGIFDAVRKVPKLKLKPSDTAGDAGTKSITSRSAGKLRKLFIQMLPFVVELISPVNTELKLFGKFLNVKFLVAVCVPGSHSKGPRY